MSQSQTCPPHAEAEATPQEERSSQRSMSFASVITSSPERRSSLCIHSIYARTIGYTIETMIPPSGSPNPLTALITNALTLSPSLKSSSKISKLSFQMGHLPRGNLANADALRRHALDNVPSLSGPRAGPGAGERTSRRGSW